MRTAGSAGSSGTKRASFRGTGVPRRRAFVRLVALATTLVGALAASGAQSAPLRDSPPAATAPLQTHAMAAGHTTLRYNGTIKGLDAPFAVAINHLSRKIYVTEPNRHRVVVFDRLGRRRGTFGRAFLNRPGALAFDFAGNLAVLSTGAREIVWFRPSGVPLARSAVPASSRWDWPSNRSAAASW